MIRILLTAAVSAAALSSGALAQGFTLGAGYAHVDADGANVDAVTLRGGYEFTRYLGVEGEVAFGFGDDTIMIGATPVEVELNHSFGLFGIVRAPVIEGGNLFARVGYVSTEVEGSLAGFTSTADDEAWAYGVGGEYFFDGRNGLRIDYTRHDYDGGNADVWGVSYVRRFGAW